MLQALTFFIAVWSLLAIEPISSDPGLLFDKVATLDLRDKTTDVPRTDIKIDPFGGIYVSLDGSNIAIGDTQKVYSERPPVWTAASGDSRLFYAMPREGRLVVAQSYDGGRTFQSERLVANGFRNAVPAVQGNLALLETDNGPKLYNVFLNTARNEIQLARCLDPCQRFTVRRIHAPQAGDESTFDHPNPYVAVDRGTGLYVVFSDGRDVFLMSSVDNGDRWSEPVRVNERSAGSAERATSPAIIAGDPGRVGIVWLQGSRVFAASAHDALSTTPAFHPVLVFDSANPTSSPAISMGPNGAMWISLRTSDNLIVMRQASGEPLTTGLLWSAVGELEAENASRQLSVEIRKDLTGRLSYCDGRIPLCLKADRFTMQKREGGEIAISGNGRLQNGTSVSFTVLAPESPNAASEMAISMSNGYFAAGTLKSPNSVEANLHIVAQGGNSFRAPR